MVDFGTGNDNSFGRILFPAGRIARFPASGGQASIPAPVAKIIFPWRTARSVRGRF